MHRTLQAIAEHVRQATIDDLSGPTFGKAWWRDRHVLVVGPWMSSELKNWMKEVPGCPCNNEDFRVESVAGVRIVFDPNERTYRFVEKSQAQSK